MQFVIYQYVDEVVLGAPLEISKEFIDTLKINVVCCGSTPHSYTDLPDTYKVGVNNYIN